MTRESRAAARAARLCALLIAAAPAAAPATPATQPASQPAPVRPDEDRTPYETTVTGRRTPPEGVSVQEIGDAELERQGALTAADALERTAAIYATSGMRGERIFALRGFDQRQVAVLLDGAPFYVTYDGQVDLAMVPALALDHITIVKGPSSILFGPNGLGGAVNLVTRRPGVGPLVAALFEANTESAVRFAASHSYTLGPWAWSLYGGFDHQDHFQLPSSYKATPLQPAGDRINSDRFMWNVGADGSLRIGATQQIRLTLMAVDGGRGVPPSTYDATPHYWRFSEWRAIATSLAHEGRYGSWDVDEMVYVRQFDNLLDSFDDGTYSTQNSLRAFHSWYHDWVVGARVRSQYRRLRTPIGTLFVRGWLGFQEDLHEDIPGGSQPTMHYSRTLVTAAPEVELDPTRRWRLIVSGQFDADVPGSLPEERPHTRWGEGPLASVQYEPVDDLVLRATAARRTRFPSLKERFSSAFGLREPNPGLSPENAWHFGFDAAWRLSPWLRAEAAFYDAEVADLIDDVPLGNGKDQLQNVGTARLLGVEAFVSVRPVRRLELRLGYNWLHARRTDGGPHDQLAYNPAHRVIVAAIVTPWRCLDVWALLRVVGPQDYQDPVTLDWGRLGAYAVLDARIEARPARWLAVWVRGTNLLDSNYQTQIGYPDPGRQIWIGLKLTEE